MTDMELFQLRYFVEAAHRLHFTQAAEAVCVSQPSLSQQIANLETEVGARLFVRQGRSVALTDAGRALLRHAERMLEEEALGRRAVQEVLGLQRGQLTLYTLPTPGQYLLPPLLAEFRRKYPQITISLREMVPARLVAEGVSEGRADIGIVHLPYQVEGLQEHILLQEDLALVVPDAHPFASRSHVALAEAAGEDFIWAPEGASPAHPLYAACIAAGFAPHIACVSGSAQGMQSLVFAGLGIALLPRLAIHAPAGTCVVELAEPRPMRTLAAVWREAHLSHAARAFLEQLRGINHGEHGEEISPPRRKEHQKN